VKAQVTTTREAGVEQIMKENSAYLLLLLSMLKLMDAIMYWVRWTLMDDCSTIFAVLEKHIRVQEKFKKYKMQHIAVNYLLFLEEAAFKLTECSQTNSNVLELSSFIKKKTLLLYN
jgi:hypothetical protein